MKIVAASGIYQWFLATFDYGAITMPWQTIHVRQDRLAPEYSKLLDHEKVHIAQIQRMGAVKWTITYLWYNLVYGYYNNPLEIEARKLSGW